MSVIGRFVCFFLRIYLCEGFFKIPHEQIAVLIHEASHQATAAWSPAKKNPSPRELEVVPVVTSGIFSVSASMFKAYTDDVCADKTLPMDSKDCPQGRKALAPKKHIYSN